MPILKRARQKDAPQRMPADQRTPELEGKPHCAHAKDQGRKNRILNLRQVNAFDFTIVGSGSIAGVRRFRYS